MSILPRRALAVMIAAMAVFAIGPAAAFAQDAGRAAPDSNVARKVLLDPTTVAPAVISYELRQLDWKSSQIFFRNGWFEHNADFTVSGRPDDVAVSYRDGRRRNIDLALVEVPIALAHNTASHALEQRLTDRYPQHRTLWRALGWVERFSFSAYRASLVSIHYTQWRQNERTAAQLGIK